MGWIKAQKFRKKIEKKYSGSFFQQFENKFHRKKSCNTQDSLVQKIQRPMNIVETLGEKLGLKEPCAHSNYINNGKP